MESDPLSHIQEALKNGADFRVQLLGSHAQTFVEISERLANCFLRNGKVLIFGNGGSASQAQHMAAELVGRYRLSRVALPALALTADSAILTAVSSAILTAISNDYSFDQVFSRQIEALGWPSDVAVAISTSGKSANVIQGIQTARARGLPVVALSGAEGMATLVDVEVTIPSSNTALYRSCILRRYT